MSAYVIPDTNVLLYKLDELINRLQLHKHIIIIGIPQIPIDESLGRSLYRLVCKRDDRTVSFREKLDEVLTKFKNHGFVTAIVPIPCVYGLSRYNFCYLVDEETWKVMSRAITSFLEMGYLSTLKQLVNLFNVEDDDNLDDAFHSVLYLCCNNTKIKGYAVAGSLCRTVYSMLGDVLLIMSCYYVLRFKAGFTILVTEERKYMPRVANNVLGSEFTDMFYAINLDDLQGILQKLDKI